MRFYLVSSTLGCLSLKRSTAPSPPRSSPGTPRACSAPSSPSLSGLPALTVQGRVRCGRSWQWASRACTATNTWLRKRCLSQSLALKGVLNRELLYFSALKRRKRLTWPGWLRCRGFSEGGMNEDPTLSRPQGRMGKGTWHHPRSRLPVVSCCSAVSALGVPGSWPYLSPKAGTRGVLWGCRKVGWTVGPSDWHCPRNLFPTEFAHIPPQLMLLVKQPRRWSRTCLPQCGVLPRAALCPRCRRFSSEGGSWEGPGPSSHSVSLSLTGLRVSSGPGNTTPSSLLPHPR